MTKSLLLSVFIFVFIFLGSGCTLVKGVGGAVVGFGKGAALGAAEGFKDDTNFIKKTDNWIKRSDNWTKDNLW